MTKLISSINITPDGFCSHSDVVADDEHHQFAIDLLKSADIVLFGRITFQLFESYWPSAAKDESLPVPMLEFARLIDKIEKVVASLTLKSAQWKNTRILQEINKESIGELKQKVKNNILIFGSPGLVSALTNLNLIDEYYFSVQPIIAGKGKRFFENFNLISRHRLILKEIKQFHSGVITLCYQNKSN